MQRRSAPLRDAPEAERERRPRAERAHPATRLAGAEGAAAVDAPASRARTRRVARCLARRPSQGARHHGAPGRALAARREGHLHRCAPDGGTVVGRRYRGRRPIPREVMRARLAVEPELAREAALHATSEDIAEMKLCVAGARSAETWRQYENWDNRLHRAIAERIAQRASARAVRHTECRPPDGRVGAAPRRGPASALRPS